MVEIKNRIKLKSGLTLIELMVSVTLLAVIIISAVSFYSYGTRSFSDGEKRASVQRNVRLAAELITNELRNTSALNITGQAITAPSGFNRGFKHTGTTLVRFGGTGEQNIELISEVKFSVSNQSGKAMLHYTVKGKSAAQEYKIDSQILLSNIGAEYFTGKLVFNNEYNLNSNILYYNKP